MSDILVRNLVTYLPFVLSTSFFVLFFQLDFKSFTPAHGDTPFFPAGRNLKFHPLGFSLFFFVPRSLYNGS